MVDLEVLLFVLAQHSTESVLQKFRKTFSLRFHQKKGSKESCNAEPGEAAPPVPEDPPEPTEEDNLSSPRHVPTSDIKDDQKDKEYK